MGLLDGNIDDPKTQALLAMGFGLLNSRGSFGQGLGQAGAQSMAAYTDARRQQQQRAMQEQQMQAQQQALQMQRQTMEQQQAQAQRMAEAERMRGGYLNSIDPSAGPAQPFNPIAAMRAGLNASEIGAIGPQAGPKPLIVGKTVLDPTTMKPLYQEPHEPVKDKEIERLKLIYGEGTPAYEGALKDYGRKMTTHQPAPSATVKVGGLFEKEYDKDQGKSFSEMMASINKTAFSAPAQLRKLERMEALLDGVDGGKLAPVGLEVASMANSVGIKMDPKLGNKEASQALAREIAGGFRQPGTGPMTDKDFENFLLQVPDLSKSATGRKQITTTMKAALTRDLQVAKMAREYERKNGKLDNSFLDQAAQYIAENPVVGMPSGWKVR